MGFSPIDRIEREKIASRGIGSWIKNYKEAFVQHPHDTSQLYLVLPDDCLVVAGPTRLRHASGKTAGINGTALAVKSDEADGNFFFPIGFANNVSYTETRQVQPLKGIGSRRHIFAATNSPVQLQIARLMLVGTNMLRSLYANTTFGPDMDTNSKFSQNANTNNTADWFSNVEEDLFRVPIGLGIIYNSPATLSNQQTYAAGAEYFEVCTLQSKSVSIQSGQAMIMEQVTLLADRCIPWVTVAGGGNNSILIKDAHAWSQVRTVAEMHGNTGKWNPN